MSFPFIETYDYPPYRPPNEANSALIRVTRGCPWNRCLFCTMYKDARFEMKPVDEVMNDIDSAGRIWPKASTVFIADSDSLVHKDIVPIVKHIAEVFPEARSRTSYARARTLKHLGVEKLSELRKAGLTRVHVGLESGDALTLDSMCKGASPEEMIEGGLTAKKAGIELSFYILIGAGGKARLREHAVASAEVCNAVQPDFIRLRTLVVQRGSLLDERMQAGEYEPTSPLEKLQEVRTFLEALDVDKCEFASDHFTNYIFIDGERVYDGIYGYMPDDKQMMLDKLNRAIEIIESSDGEVLDATMMYERGMINSL